MAAGGKGLQCPGDGVASRLNAGGEEQPKLAGQQVVGQGLPGDRVSQAQQVGRNAHILCIWRPSGLHLSTHARDTDSSSCKKQWCARCYCKHVIVRGLPRGLMLGKTGCLPPGRALPCGRGTP